MVDSSRAQLRRMDQEQTRQYKRTMIYVIFLIVTLVMITGTFLNPFFMKKQIRTGNTQAVVVRQVNSHFDRLSDLIGANREQDSNLLTVQQTQPIADHIINYSLGLHGLRVSNLNLANQILTDINQNIDRGASSDAQQVRQKLKKEKGNAIYAVVQAFDLNVVTLGANIAVLLIIVNIIIIIVTIIALWSLINDMHSRTTVRAVIHDSMAAGMWTGFWLILVFGLLALIPIIFNVENLPFPEAGYLLEISSSIFLEFVIAGVVIFVGCTIPWQLTTTN